MRRTFLILTALLSVLVVGSFTLGRANAVPLAAPAGIAAADEATRLTENVACGWRWRCGRWGCGWRWVCWAPRVYGYYGYPYAYGFYGRPYYWGGGWRYRHWRRW